MLAGRGLVAFCLHVYVSSSRPSQVKATGGHPLYEPRPPVHAVYMHVDAAVWLPMPKAARVFALDIVTTAISPSSHANLLTAYQTLSETLPMTLRQTVTLTVSLTLALAVSLTLALALAPSQTLALSQTLSLDLVPYRPHGPSISMTAVHQNTAPRNITRTIAIDSKIMLTS